MKYFKDIVEAHPNSKIYDKCWDGYRKVPGKKRGEKGSCEKVNEAYDPWDEADVWYKFDLDAQKLRQKSWYHAQEREARANGWHDSHDKAMKAHGYFPSKFKRGEYVRKGVDGNWIKVYPYADKTVKEFAPDSSGDGGDDGFSEETLKRFAAQWYNGDEDPQVEKTLAAAGWEIGQDEGYDDEPGVFVVQAGDINGNSYLSWPADELREGVEESKKGKGSAAYKEAEDYLVFMSDALTDREWYDESYAYHEWARNLYDLGIGGVMKELKQKAEKGGEWWKDAYDEFREKFGKFAEERNIERGMAEGQQMGEYSRVLQALRLYYPRLSMEELNTPDWYRVIANKANVPVEYAGKVINDFTRPVNNDDDYDESDEEQGVAEGWKDVVAGGAMALGALGAGAQTMPDINVQQLKLANKYYAVLVQRAKEDGRSLDTRTLNFLKAKAQDAAARKFQQSTQQSTQQSQQGFPSVGSERRVAKDAWQFESQGVAEGIGGMIAGSVSQFVGNKIDPLHGEIMRAHGEMAGRKAEYTIRKYMHLLQKALKQQLDSDKDKGVAEGKEEIPQEIYNLLDELSADDTGSEEFGDYVLRFEGFTDWCQQDAADRCKLSDNDPRKLKYYEDVYAEVLQGWAKEQGAQPVDKGFAGSEDYPVQWAVFKKQGVAEGSEFGAYYYERLAQQVFDTDKNLDASGRANQVMDAGFAIASKELGKKQAQYLFAYDEDFPSDFVSAYTHLQKAVAEASDPSGLLHAARHYNREFLITAKTAEGATKRYRVKAQSERVAREKFQQHYNQAEILDVKEDTKENTAMSADTSLGYKNTLAVMKAADSSQEAKINLGGEPVTLDYPEARFIAGKYKAFLRAGRQEEFFGYMSNPQQFDSMMKQLRGLHDKQKAFKGSVPGERNVPGETTTPWVREGQKKYDDSHGSPYDRGGADSWYDRPRQPHKGGVGGDSGPRIEDLTPDEIEAYHAGYDDNEKSGGKKQWESADAGIDKVKYNQLVAALNKARDSGDMAKAKQIGDELIKLGKGSFEIDLHGRVKTIAENLRLVGKHGDGAKTAKVYKDHEWGEYRVKFYTDGKHEGEEADYHTDDKDDANDTAKSWTTKGEKVTENTYWCRVEKTRKIIPEGYKKTSKGYIIKS